MNETIQTLLERRSIRSFRTKQIEASDLELILKTGRYAATGRGVQPWHFTVVQDDILLEDIANTCKDAFIKSDDPFYERLATFHTFHHAPTVIFISTEETERYGPVDAANATQNMANAAWSLGIGSCYIASFLMAFSGDKRASFIERLKLPDDYAPVFCLALGYPKDDIPEAASRKQDTINYIR